MSEYYADSDVGGEFATPEWLWRPLAHAVGGFDLDPASGVEATPIADKRYTGPPDGTDGLAAEWHGRVWLNPPYGRGLNRDWGETALAECRSGRVTSLTALVPLSSGTEWFHETYTRLAETLTLVDPPGDGTRRVRFEVPAGDGRTTPAENTATFASAIVSWGSFPSDYYQRLADTGPTFTRGGETVVQSRGDER
ncbi:hypothetical protein BRD18_04245 [Halobacteriales archaeon SW_7_71_33]|nr:MAG: hypothetical protein BRD18_04245 [Halobacteriales archaeon SW_7_71_33]